LNFDQRETGRPSTEEIPTKCKQRLQIRGRYGLLEEFFDTVCQSKLIEILARTVTDGRVMSLVYKYLNAGVVSRGLFEKTEVGMPQGSPLQVRYLVTSC
jgi:hypothetical protein